MQLLAATEGNQVLSKSASLPAEPFENSQQTAGTPAWKQEVNQRLAAHRTRRGSAQDTSNSQEGQSARAASDRAAAAAARVAARYAKAPSYSELLAGEARAVVRAAGAAAEAARNAQAAAQAVLEGLEAGFEPSHDPGHAPQQFWEPAPQPAQSQVQAASRWQDEPPPAPAAQTRWQAELPAPATQIATQDDVWSEMRVYPRQEPAPAHRRDAEREYRHHRGEAHTYESDESGLFSGEFASAVVEPVQHLPANLIEFPRELVATRKARPRLADGPFYNPAHEEAQLNIFEVDPSQMSDEPAISVAPPEWASIELDHPRRQTHPEPVAAVQAYAHMPEVLSSVVEAAPAEEKPFGSYSFVAVPHEARALETAPYVPVQPASPTQTVQTPRKAVSNAPVASAAPELLVATASDRLLAAVVDGALVTLAYLAAAVVVIASTTHPPAGRTALVASACGLTLFWMLYEYLFLSYAEEGTPGMRYARIALCTFEDENPTLEQMRMRIPAMLLAALPGGLGLVWALWDKNHLGWQDRLTKTYQRKY